MPKEDALRRKRLRKTKAQLVDELEQLERRHSDDQFANTIAVLQEGFALYDADDRLVLFNEEYRRLHPQMDDILKPGMLFEDLVRTNIERGLNADAIGHEKKHIRERMERHRNPKGPILRTLTDGTSYVIKESRTPDGGVVVTETDTTELKQAEKALRKNEALLRTVVDNSPTKIHIKDVEGRYTLINKEAEKLFGITDKEGRGKTSYDLFPKDVADAFMVHDKAVIESGQAKEEEEEFILEDGVHTFLTVKFPIYDLDGVSGVGAIGTDITERKRAEAELERQKTLFEAVFRDVPDAMVLTDNKRNIIMCNPALTRIFGYKADDILGKNTVALYESREEYERQGRIRFNLDADKKLEPYVVSYKRNDGKIFPGETVGTAIQDRDGNTLGFIGVIRDITERRRAEQALRTSEERFRVVVDNLPSAILLKDVEGRYLLANKEFNNWFNPEGRELVGKTTYDFVSKETADLITAQDRAVMKAETAIEREIDITFADGTVHTTILHKFPIFDSSGQCVAVGGINTDITDRAKAEEALRTSEERLRGAIESLQEGFALFDADDRLVALNDKYRHVNPAAQGIMERGGTFEDLIRANMERGALVEAIGREEAFIKDRLKKHRNPKEPIIRRISDGSWYMLQEAKTPEGGTALSFIDITDLKETEEALIKSEERLRGAIDSMQEGFVLFDAEDRLVMVNDVYRRINPSAKDFLERRMCYEDLIRANMEKGRIVEAIGREEEFLRERIEQHRNPKGPIIRHMSDGKCYILKEVRTPEGGIAITFIDITEQKQAEEALRTSQARLMEIFAIAPEAVITVGSDMNIQLFNTSAERILGYKADEVLGRPLEMLMPETFREGHQKHVEEFDRSEDTYRLMGQRQEIMCLSKDGTEFPASASVSKLEVGGEKIFTVMLQDITERRQAKLALQESEALLKSIFENVTVGLLIKDSDHIVERANDTYLKWYGFDADTMAGRRSDEIEDFQSPEEAKFMNAQEREVLITGRTKTRQVDRLFADGQIHTIAITKFPVYDQQGNITKVGSVSVDLTEQVKARKALENSEMRFRDFAESAGDWIWEMGPDLCFTFLSGRFYELFPVEPEKIIGKTRDEFAGATQDDEQWRKHLSTIANHESFRDFEYAVTEPSGHTQYIRISGKSIFDGDGKFKGYRGTGTDVTVAVEAEAAAAKAKADLFDAIESITAGFALFDSDDRLVLCNTRYRGLHPILAELAVPGVAFREIIEGAAKGGLYHDSMGPPDALLERRFDLHRDTPSSHEQHYSDGRWLRINEYSTHDGGTVLLWTDITEHKLLERQLAGSQRMEAIGKLTGGVAHDFNNLLTVVLGNLQLLERRVAGDPRLEKYVATASGAAQRGAELTARLLAFSRRQVLETSVFDVNDLVSEIDALLQGTLGETIQFKTILAENAWPVRADPTQLENALLNLAINARDAMPDGGKMTVETANVTLDDSYAGQNPGADPGDYVMVAVGDTGVGMPPEILDHVFEPFFTTKEVGKGTGLGLSMVYGFVKQSKGYIKAYSEPGHGSVVKLYLPSAEGDEKTLIAKPATGEATIGGDETILVVEDDSEVRETAVALLKELGYRVVEAEDGPSALRVLDAHPDVGLLFTDVIMPGGMNGPELADEVRRRRPGMKVLYTSGYTEDGIVRNGMLEAGVTLLGKPFQKNEMAAKVRRVLDS